MTNFFAKASPTITTMIRLDHSHVLAAFRRYHPSSPGWRKQAIVESVCIALEIHARLEEEIFYPALSRVAPDNEVLRKSAPEHDRLRTTIQSLRSMSSEHPAYDELFMQLIRETLRHVADEETILLPLAERSLRHELRQLGAAMTCRRMELLCERPLDVAVNTARTFPIASTLLAAIVACGIGSVLCSRRPQGRAAPSPNLPQRAT